jgi:hypothetical protein
MKKMAAVLCAAVLTLSACGNGDDDKAKENIKSAVLEDEGTELTSGTKPTEEQADCISDGMVDDVGVEKLQEYELLNDDLEINDDANPTDMDEGDADALAGVFVDCIDVEEMFASQFGSGEEELPAEAQDCITEAIDEDAMKDGLSASFQGKEDEAFQSMQEEMMACVMGEMPGAEE